MPTMMKTSPTTASQGPTTRETGRFAWCWGAFIAFGLLVLSISAGRSYSRDEPGPLALRDVSAESGLDFRYDNGSRGRHDLPEIMGGGLALIDFDGDGLLDVFLTNGGPIVPAPGRDDPPCRLFRNLGACRFQDVSAQAHAPGPPYAMGCAVGDYDGDGRDDLFVTGWRDQRLYRSLGGRFEDVTKAVGLSSDLWSTSAAFADLDGDGDLDLYVCNYVDYDPLKSPFCAAPDGRRDYCGPEDFAAQPHRLYRNDGGRFTDVSKALGDWRGRGLGVLIADLTGDHRPDMFVVNDGDPCRLLANRRNWDFDEVGATAGLALDGEGRPLAGMGVALGDVDGDGRSDLLVGNLFGRSTVAFQALGRGLFRDASSALGLAIATRDVTGFGLALVDINGDGLMDLLQANGHVLDRERLGVPFAMRPIVMRNEGSKLVRATSDWERKRTLGRGLAIGDIDNDGRPDVIMTSLDSAPLVLRNESAGNWRTVCLEGPSANGARVWATIGQRVLVREVHGGGSYLSASERSMHFRERDDGPLKKIVVRWPTGRSEEWHDFGQERRVRLIEATGRATTPPD